MAASLHRVARLSRELQQHPDLLALYDTPTQDATTRITVPQSQWQVPWRVVVCVAAIGLPQHTAGYIEDALGMGLASHAPASTVS